MSKRLSIEDMQHLAAKQGGKCLSDIYVNNRLPLEWECSKKHRWFARPSNIKSGHWCPYCSPNAAAMLGNEGLLKKCQQIAESRGGNCLSDIYVTARKPLQWQCSKGHIWEATPDNVKRGKWCPECAKVAIQLAKIKYSKDECEQYAKKRGGKLVKADTQYRNKWLWECSNGHQWNASPSQVVGSQTWCKRCLSYEAYSDKILQSLTKRNIRIISGKIINAKSRLLLECKKGHRWEASIASVYLAKSGCPLCAGHLRLSIEDAQKVAALKGGRCLSRQYKNARSQLLWVCEKGHKWKATFGSVSGGQSGNGTWCPTCSLENIQPKYTTGDAISLAESRGGKFLSAEMKKVVSLYTWQCANGHTWKASFSSIYNNGSWCPTCSRHLGERLTRIAFETLFQHQFPTARPAWLRTELGAQLSLDGYCKALELAFEHQANGGTSLNS
jgi:hypothetical protein